MIRLASLLFLWLPIAMAGNETYEPCESCTWQASTSKLAAIKLRLYTGETVDEYTEVVVGEAVGLMDQMNLSQSTVVYTHGLFGTPNWKSSEAIAEAYIKRGNHNVVLLDWASIADTEWFYAGRSVPGVGYTLATVLNEWVAAGMEVSSLHIVGHSLGAQVSGYAGRYANFTLSRIVGLDPASFLFYTALEHVKSGDAAFVEIIHTDAGVIGIDLQTGDVDFYPNGGVELQPGCLIPEVCSHLRACFYYAESVRNETAFIGRACDSNSAFEEGSCDSNDTVVMGYATPTTASGAYYLETNSDTPYGRGEEGATYEHATNLVSATAESLWKEIKSIF
ncbi:phospholipase A1 VesT1.02 [Neodiprion lecontei]|uniref:phospholipase A1 n=1 Tax=Neodiprion lecontei TaxID=441921 RepID=A0A6J0BPB8_NEOLC|nr:phospholipase A1 VesT1.02 [Neodiprion lecontei]